MTGIITARPHRSALALATLGALALTACGGATTRTTSTGEVVPVSSTIAMGSQSMAQMLASWPAMQRDAATMMSTKYGTPDVTSDRMLVWANKGPYTRIVLMRDAVQHDFPMPHQDFLTHTIKHAVPTNMLDELGAYDGSVWVHRTRGELSAQCDTEEHNNLALNLAHEVAMGRRTVEDARMMYAKTAMELKKGMSSPYASGLMFQVEPNAADAGKAVQMP